MSRLSLELSVENYASYSKTVEAAKNLGIQANAAMNGIKVDTNLGKSFADQIKIAETSADSFTKKIEDVKKTNDTATLKPTISRHWENEANQVAASVRKAETAIGGLKNKSYTPGQPLGFKIPATEPTAKTVFADSYKSAFDDIDSRLQKTQSSFQKLVQTKGDKGQFDTIYQGAFAAEKKVNDLTNRVRALRKEAADPANSAFGKQYAAGIRDAEKELSRLEIKQRALSRSAGAGGGRGRKGLGEVGRTVLEVADDFVPEGFNRPFNAAVKGLAETTFSAAGIGTIAGVAALGAVIVKVTSDIRAQAEQRLKTEEKITATINKQLLAAKELKDAFDTQQKDASFERRIQFYQQVTSIEQLRGRKDLLNNLINLVPNSENIAEYRKEFDALNKQVSDFDQKQKLDKLFAPNNAFAQGFENYKNARQSEIESQLKAAEIFAKSVEDGKAKVKELGATFREVLDSLYDKANTQNPFVSVFSEGEKALKSLREQLKGLPADMQNSALSMQQRINRNALFETRLGNNLDVFDLRDRAAQFRNPYDAARTAKEREEIAKRYGDAGGYVPGGNFGSFLSKQAGGFDKLNPNQIREIYETSLLNANSQFNGGNNQNSLISVLAGQRLRDENQNLSLNERLQKQIGIIYGGAGSADEKAIADRKLLSISSGLNPNEIDSNLRDNIASANEREADRKERAEKEAIKLQEKQVALQTRIADNQEALLKVVNEKGLKGLNDFLEITVKDETSGGVKTLGAQPQPSDMIGNVFGEFNQ